MLVEWSVECAADDPVLVIPWADPDGGSAFIDLRADLHAIDTIPEAEQHPSLMQALRALNAQRSPVFTAKCDAWPVVNEEVEHLRLDLEFNLGLNPAADLGIDVQSAPHDGAGAPALFGFASYIDLVCRERSLFASFPRHEHLLRQITRLAAPLDHPAAALELVLRPAFLQTDTPQQGYAISLYVKALGETPQRAESAWAAALGSAVAIVRRKDIFR
jgi:hypothetical protein